MPRSRQGPPTPRVPPFDLFRTLEEFLPLPWQMIYVRGLKLHLPHTPADIALPDA